MSMIEFERELIKNEKHKTEQNEEEKKIIMDSLPFLSLNRLRVVYGIRC